MYFPEEMQKKVNLVPARKGSQPPKSSQPPKRSAEVLLSPSKNCDETVAQLRRGLNARKGVLASSSGSQPSEEQPPAGHLRISPFPLAKSPPPAPPTPPAPPNRLPPTPPSPPRQDSPPPPSEEPSEDKVRSSGDEEGLDIKVDKELIRMKENLQVMYQQTQDKTLERQYVLASLDSILPEIVGSTTHFSTPNAAATASWKHKKLNVS